MTRSLLALTCAWLLAGCGGRVGGPPGGKGVIDSGTAESAVSNGDASTTVDGGGPDGPDGVDAEADAADSADWMQQATVWIGQVDSTVTYPADFSPDQPQKVILVLGPVNGSTLIGTVTFGSGAAPPPPTSAAEPYPPVPATFDAFGVSEPIGRENWTEAPYDGFTYSLVSSMLRGGDLLLAFAPSELWSAWCALQDPRSDRPIMDPGMDAFGSSMPVCSCDATSCRAASVPTRQLDFVVTGSAMQGQLEPSPSPLSAAATIRLQRVQ